MAACVSHFKGFNSIPSLWMTVIQIYNILIGILNVGGNGILIWALRKTGQTKSLSFQLIAVMSASDFTIGVTGLVFISPMLLERHQSNCSLTLITEFILITCNYISMFLLFLIALDRYLHMKYLEAYHLIVTKKRGYFLIIGSFFLALSTGVVFILQFTLIVHIIVESVYTLLTLLLLASVMIMYYSAMRALRRKAHQVTRSIINHNRALGAAAKRISICIIVFSSPIFVLLVLDNINTFMNLWDASLLNTLRLFSYITFLGNGFCNSMIFISQNVSIRRYLKRVTFHGWHLTRSVVGTMETNA